MAFLDGGRTRGISSRHDDTISQVKGFAFREHGFEERSEATVRSLGISGRFGHVGGLQVFDGVALPLQFVGHGQPAEIHVFVGILAVVDLESRGLLGETLGSNIGRAVGVGHRLCGPELKA